MDYDQATRYTNSVTVFLYHEKPIFTFLYLSWCPFAEKFMDIWQILQKDEELQKLVSFKTVKWNTFSRHPRTREILELIKRPTEYNEVHYSPCLLLESGLSFNDSVVGLFFSTCRLEQRTAEIIKNWIKLQLNKDIFIKTDIYIVTNNKKNN